MSSAPLGQGPICRSSGGMQLRDRGHHRVREDAARGLRDDGKRRDWGTPSPPGGIRSSSTTRTTSRRIGDSRSPASSSVTTRVSPPFSNLNRPNVFRFNIAVGRRKFEELLGYAPSAQAQHHDEFDYTAADALLPHPAYATHAWVSIVNPSQLDQQAKDLLVGEYELAVKRHPTL